MKGIYKLPVGQGTASPQGQFLQIPGPVAHPEPVSGHQACLSCALRRPCPPVMNFSHSRSPWRQDPCPILLHYSCELLSQLQPPYSLCFWKRASIKTMVIHDKICRAFPFTKKFDHYYMILCCLVELCLQQCGLGRWRKNPL